VEREAWTLAEAVTWRIDAADPRLRLSDRAMLRLPAVMRRIWPRVERAPAGSPLRRRLLERVMVAGWGAMTAKRVDDAARFVDEDIVLVSGSDAALLDFAPVTRGRAAWCAANRRVFEDTASVHWTPEELIDLGGARFGVRVRVDVTGRSSGIGGTILLTTVYEARDGRAVRQWITTDDAEIDAWLAERRAELEGERG
jgi:hypothetical protein